MNIRMDVVMVESIEKLTASVLTLSHMLRKGSAGTESGRKYSHDEVVDEFEDWLGYVSGEGEPVSPIERDGEE